MVSCREPVTLKSTVSQILKKEHNVLDFMNNNICGFGKVIIKQELEFVFIYTNSVSISNFLQTNHCQGIFSRL